MFVDKKSVFGEAAFIMHNHACRPLLVLAIPQKYPDGLDEPHLSLILARPSPACSSKSGGQEAFEFFRLTRAN